MRWTVAIVVGYVLFGLELVVRRELALGGGDKVSPGFLLPFVVFVALYAPARTAMWVGLIVGVLLDLLSVRGEGDVVVGPHALGFAAAAYLTLAARASVFSHRRTTMAVLSVGGALLAELIAVTLMSVRSMWGGMEDWQPMASSPSRLALVSTQLPQGTTHR